MKLLTISVLMLIASSQCNPTDGVFGTVKDTTSAITNSIGDMLSRGRSLVFGDNHEEETVKEGKPAVPSQGIIDKISLKIHAVSEGVRETVRNVLKVTDKDTNENGKGIIKHVFEGATNKVGKVKGLLFGTTTMTPREKYEADDDAALKELVDKAMANNNSSQERVDTYNVLSNILENARKNASKVNNPKYDGSGLLDIRTVDLEGMEKNMKDTSDNAINGINTAYDKVEDDVSRTYNRGKESFDSFRQNAADNINNGKNYVKENIDRFAIDARSNFEKYTN